MKEIKIMLSEREIELLMYATQAYSAHVKLEAASGKRDKDQSKDLTDRLCAINSKLYYRMIEYHNKH